ncbi:MAG: hypothetical protein ACP5QO_09735 [Clostridia bacterium]
MKWPTEAHIVGTQAALSPWARIGPVEGRVWTSAVKPTVMKLSGGADNERITRLYARPDRAEHSPYGWSVGSWIEEERGVPVVHVLPDWSIPLAFTFGQLPEHLTDPAILGRMVKARLRMGVAADVWEPFVPQPPSTHYSLVRHPALMMAGSWSWLGVTERELWRRVLEALEERARVRFRGVSDLSVVVNETDVALRQLWDTQVENLERADWFFDRHDSRREVFRLLLDYALLSSMATLSFIGRLEHQDPRQWPEQLQAWASGHRQEDFLARELNRWWTLGVSQRRRTRRMVVGN